MSDLREVLQQHADSVSDEVAAVRVHAVHRRIRAARRRRASAAAVVTAAVVAVVGLVVTLPREDHAPAAPPATLVGRVVPRSVQSLGSTFSYVKGVVGSEGRITVHLPASERGYVVRAASATSKGQIVIRATGDSGPWVTKAGRFGSFTAVPSGTTASVTVHLRGGRGPVALAVYRWTSPPAGYTRHGVTYAAVSAGEPLLGAWIGRPGADTHVLHLGDTASKISIHPYCSAGLPKGARLAVSTSRSHGAVEIGCDLPSPWDPGEEGTSAGGAFGGKNLRVSVRLVDKQGHRIAVPAGARIGVGVYRWGVRAGNHGFPDFIDEDGHSWKLGVIKVGTRAAGTPLSMRLDFTVPGLLAYSSASRRGTATASVPGGQSASLGGGGRSETVIANGLPDQRVSVRSTTTSRLGLAIYRLPKP